MEETLLENVESGWVKSMGELKAYKFIFSCQLTNIIFKHNIITSWFYTWYNTYEIHELVLIVDMN